MIAGLVILLGAAVASPSYDVRLLTEWRADLDSVALQLSPLLSVAAAPAPAAIGVRYQPRLVRSWSNSFAGWSDSLQRADASIEVFGRRGLRVFSVTQGVYGKSGFSPLSSVAEGAPPALVLPLSSRPLSYRGFDTTAGTEGEIGRRGKLVISAGYAVSGAISREDRSQLPIFRTVRLAGAFSLPATRDDTFEVAVRGSSSRIDATAVHPWVATSLLGWRRRLSSALEADLSLGASLARGSDARTGVEPTASLTLRSPSAERRFDFDAAVRVVPYTDPVDGTIQVRPEVAARGNVRLSRTLLVEVVGSAAPLKGPDGRRTTYAVGSLGLSWRASRHLQLSAGSRLASFEARPVSVFVALVSGEKPLW